MCFWWHSDPSCLNTLDIFNDTCCFISVYHPKDNKSATNNNKKRNKKAAVTKLPPCSMITSVSFH